MRKVEGEGSVGIELDEDFGEYNLNDLECHEAGYDALMTGYSFLKGASLLKVPLTSMLKARSFAQ